MEKKIGNIFKGDKVIWMVFFFLCVISIIEVFSASSELTYKNQNYLLPIIKHSSILFVGIIVTICTAVVPCRYFKILLLPLLIISLVTLLWVLVGGQSINGAQRVISILGLTFQPSEIAKGTVILIEAQILSTMQRDEGADKMAFRYILIITIPLCLLIGRENLSTAILLFGVVYIMMYVGRIPGRQILKVSLWGVGLVSAALAFILIFGHEQNANDQLSKTEVIEQTTPAKEDRGKIAKLFHRADTWKGRILKFVNGKEVAPEDYDLDKDGQVAHANIAIVSSNYIGVGPGNSTERDFLSQAFSDFIYAIIIEETGLLGAFVVIFLYSVLLFRSYKIASRCENSFPAFLCLGFALLLGVQALFNMMVAVGLAPVTGQPLPLISKGGTSTIINCAYIGAILSVSRTAKKKKEVMQIAETANK